MQIINPEMVAQHLFPPGVADNKYTRGAVLLATGSPTYPGAAVLGILGALHAGAGIVRYLGAERPEDLVLHISPEVVIGAGSFDVAVVGSGYDFSMASTIDTVARKCEDTKVPLIADAGALSGVRGWAAKNPLIIATPHAGEATKMLHQHAPDMEVMRAQVEGDVPTYAALLAKLTGAVIVLKAAQTAVATPDGDQWLFTAAGAWGGTAGAGDVLAGTIGAIVARGVAQSTQPPSPHSIAALAAAAVGLHGLSAQRASSVLGADFQPTETPGRPILASDIAHALPDTIHELLRMRCQTRSANF